MQEFIGKACYITIEIDNRVFHYSARKVLKIEQNNLYFLDKYEMLCMAAVDTIKQIKIIDREVK